MASVVENDMRKACMHDECGRFMLGKILSLYLGINYRKFSCILIVLNSDINCRMP